MNAARVLLRSVPRAGAARGPTAIRKEIFSSVFPPVNWRATFAGPVGTSRYAPTALFFCCASARSFTPAPDPSRWLLAAPACRRCDHHWLLQNCEFERTQDCGAWHG